MFNQILRDIVEKTDGGVGAVLMGYDGIAIDQFFKPREGIDLQMIAVEFAHLLKDIRRTAQILEAGAMEEVSIRTERFFVTIRTLTDEYFVALTIERDGNSGKGRYLLQREAERLRQSLA